MQPYDDYDNIDFQRIVPCKNCNKHLSDYFTKHQNKGFTQLYIVDKICDM